jgi:hypothetical protein
MTGGDVAEVPDLALELSPRQPRGHRWATGLCLDRGAGLERPLVVVSSLKPPVRYRPHIGR